MEMATIAPLLRPLLLVTISTDGPVCGGPNLGRLGMLEELGGVRHGFHRGKPQRPGFPTNVVGP